MHEPLLNRIFYACLDFHVADMDDLLIFSNDEQPHLRHIELVFSRLKDHNLYVSHKKCELLKEVMEFLGLIIGKNGLPKKVEVLNSWPKPSTLTDVRSSLGLLLFFRMVIKNFFRNCGTIHELNQAKPKYPEMQRSS